MVVSAIVTLQLEATYSVPVVPYEATMVAESALQTGDVDKGPKPLPVMVISVAPTVGNTTGERLLMVGVA